MDVFLYNQIPDNREAFAAKVKQVAANVGASTDALMLVMYFESKLNPGARNPSGTATGLIQFTEDTAKALGTSTYLLSKMNNVQQLDYVQRYLMPFKGRLTSLGNTYLAVFYPAAISRPDDYTLKLSPYWVEANKIFDTNKDGTISVGEIRGYVNAYAKNLADKFHYTLAAAGSGVALLALLAFLMLGTR